MNIIILDTGAEYIIAEDKQTLTQAIALYEMIDIAINLIDTKVETTQDDTRFIQDQIGRVLPYGFTNTMNIPQKLINDITMAIQFNKIKRFWAGLAMSTQEQEEIENIQGYEHYFSEMCTSNILSTTNNRIVAAAPDLQQRIITAPTARPAAIIFFNTIYNIAIVVENIEPTELEKDFPEFKVVKTFVDVPHQDIKHHFHKKAFASYDCLVSKLEAFMQLYNLNPPEKTEQQKIKQFVETNYTISTDIDKRMKANDLYKELVNHLCISYDQAVAFKKRAAGCLLELGLQKKRFSDAYYYYGIIKKKQEPLSLKELEDQRDTQRKQWFYTYQELPSIDEQFQKEIQARKTT